MPYYWIQSINDMPHDIFNDIDDLDYVTFHCKYK